MLLYDTQRSGNAWKIRLLAGYMGLQLKRVTLSIDRGDLREEAFLARSPLAQVPVLDLGDGRVVAESMAILHYLARNSAWWPADPYDQATCLTWLSFEQAQHMRPLAELRLEVALHRRGQANDAALGDLRAAALRALTTLDSRLSRQGPDGWVATQEQPSIADIALYPYTKLAPMGGIELEPFGAIDGWISRLESLPGYSPLFPGRPDLTYSSVEVT